MNTDDLLTMLEERPDLPVEVDDVEPVLLSDTALVLDDWSRQRGEAIYDENEAIRTAYGAVQDDELLRDRTADFASAAFEPAPELAAATKDAKVGRYMRALMSTPEFQALHAETVLDVEASELATAHFAKGWAAYAVVETPDGDLQQEMQALSHARTALQGAQDEVDSLQGMRGAFGTEDGAGTRLANEELKKRFARIRKDPRLTKICNLAGRYRHLAQTLQRRKVIHGVDDVAGIVLDDDLGRILTDELMLLADPDFELDTLRRLIESSCFCLEHMATERVPLGPIVLCVDESGSMDGERIIQAKAVALAIFWIARHQKRPILLSSYSSANQYSEVMIPAGEQKIDATLDWLAAMFGGGTDLDGPLVKAPRTVDQLMLGKVDHLIITDGECCLPDDMRNTYMQWKVRNNARLQTICIGCGAGPLGEISDNVFMANSLGLETEGLQSIFSI
jgi:uncharacterized protein with von Willebrand factor type A (vWA) domain